MKLKLDALIRLLARKRNLGRKHPKGYNKYAPHQGAQEKARRRRQMAKGQLTRSN